MKLNDRAIITLAIAPNVIYAAALIGMMVGRTLLRLSPLPHGAIPIIMGLTAFVPMASTGLANILRVRRDAGKT